VLVTFLFYDELSTKNMYDINAVIASFLPKLQQNIAQLEGFPTRAAKRVVIQRP
jgi:hypothetical protein